MGMSKPSDNDLPVAKDLTESYRTQIEEIMREEALRRISETQSPEELERLNSLSLVKLYESSDDDLIPALMSRLGIVRAALDGHGGTLLVSNAEVEVNNLGHKVLSLVINLDGACVSCG